MAIARAAPMGRRALRFSRVTRLNAAKSREIRGKDAMRGGPY
jgi:hypothetical protein